LRRDGWECFAQEARDDESCGLWHGRHLAWPGAESGCAHRQAHLDRLFHALFRRHHYPGAAAVLLDDRSDELAAGMDVFHRRGNELDLRLHDDGDFSRMVQSLDSDLLQADLRGDSRSRSRVGCAAKTGIYALAAAAWGVGGCDSGSSGAAG